uniref:Ig-like domain-containing protein n=1 Tax=Cyanistes caeruleus TaxID=156563 RepID=A0A8C0U5R7_CYACU
PESSLLPASRPSPSISLLPPSLLDLYLSTTPNITCVATNLKSPEPKFTWSRSSGGALGVATSDPAQKLPNGFYEVQSHLGICAEDWNSGDTFTCTVTAEELGPTAMVGTIRKDTGQ